MGNTELLVVEKEEAKAKVKEKKLAIKIQSILKKAPWKKIIIIGLFFLFCYFISELLNGNDVIFMKIFGFSSTWGERVTFFKNAFLDFFKFPKFVVNYFLLIFSYWIIYGLTNKTKLSCGIILVCTFLFGTANYIVTGLRGISITISDIYSVRTAINVAGGMKPTVEGNFIIATILFIALFFVLIKCIKVDEKKEIHTTRAKTITIIVGIVGMVFLCVPDYFTNGVELWNINRAYANSGAGLTIVRMAKDFKVKKPKKYESNEVRNILDKYTDDTEKIEENKDYPNIVVVMNESFSDLSLAFDIGWSEDPIECYRKIIEQENVVSGIMHSSQYGGGTANVEYEFITQNATAFLPSGSMPYQQYITKDVKQSIVSYMNKLGYNTYGMHSWDKSGYSREKIYKFLGFDNILFKDSMPNLYYEIGEYPNDQSTYEVYYDIMNNKPKGEKNFSFIVTMQNHLPYNHIDPAGIQFLPENNDITSYLQSEYLADKSLERFINYLKSYDEKTIVMFFGDHQPNLNQQSLFELTGVYNEDMATQVVPFFIWANYDIEEKSGIETSANYLESLLLDVAGMPKDSYTKYMEELRAELPVITNHYCIDIDGNSYKIDDIKSPYYDRLQEYWKIIYYNMFDNR